MRIQFINSILTCRSWELVLSKFSRLWTAIKIRNEEKKTKVYKCLKFLSICVKRFVYIYKNSKENIFDTPLQAWIRAQFLWRKLREVKREQKLCVKIEVKKLCERSVTKKPTKRRKKRREIRLSWQQHQGCMIPNPSYLFMSFRFSQHNFFFALLQPACCYLVENFRSARAWIKGAWKASQTYTHTPVGIVFFLFYLFFFWNAK